MPALPKIPFLGKKKKEEGPPKKSKEEIKAEKEAEKAEKAAERNERLLPWSLEQKVAMALNPIKIPILFMVATLGSYVEYKLIKRDHETWVAPLWRAGPTCVVNQLDEPLLNNTRLDWLNGKLNKTLYPIIHRINQSLENSSSNITENGNRRFYFADWGTLVHFKVDHCGITDDCRLEKDESGNNVLEEMNEGEKTFSALSKWRVPLLTYSLLWAVYKFVFLPFHPVDRAFRLVMGSQASGGPPPEPIFKLLTEPFFSESCPGAFVFNKVSMIGKIIRYSMLPNSLLLPIISLRSVEKCDKYIHYTYDTYLGGFIYFFILVDLVSVFGMYIIGITVKGGKCISTPLYRCYKTIWFLSLFTAITLFISDLFIVLNMRFWEGIRIQFRLFFTIVLSPNYSLDILQVLGSVSIFFDALQFTIMIFSFLCPHLLKRVPGMAGLMKDENADNNPNQDGTQSTGYQPVAGQSPSP